MPVSDKLKGAVEQAKKAAAEQEGRLEQAAHKAEAFAEEHGADVRKRIAKRAASRTSGQVQGQALARVSAQRFAMRRGSAGEPSWDPERVARADLSNETVVSAGMSGDRTL